MTIPFREFPPSYRLSQTGIGFALVALAIGGPVMRIAPQAVRIFVLGVLGAIVLGSLLISNYVIIKYPFISLVDPEDGDPFSQHYASHGSWLYRVLKFIALITPLALAAGIFCSGISDTPKLICFVYCIILVAFMLFFTIWYSPVRHPTVSTFVRSTLGLGIVLYPLYAVSIFIGAWRCRQMLDLQRE